MGGRPSGAVRLGHWKLIEHFETQQCELYDLNQDEGETHDLSAALPGKVAELQQMLRNWRRQVDGLLPTRPNPNYRGARP